MASSLWPNQTVHVTSEVPGELLQGRPNGGAASPSPKLKALDQVWTGPQHPESSSPPSRGAAGAGGSRGGARGGGSPGAAAAGGGVTARGGGPKGYGAWYLPPNDWRSVYTGRAAEDEAMMARLGQVSQAEVAARQQLQTRQAELTTQLGASYGVKAFKDHLRSKAERAPAMLQRLSSAAQDDTSSSAKKPLVLQSRQVGGKADALSGSEAAYSGGGITSRGPLLTSRPAGAGGPSTTTATTSVSSSVMPLKKISMSHYGDMELDEIISPDMRAAVRRTLAMYDMLAEHQEHMRQYEAQRKRQQTLAVRARTSLTGGKNGHGGHASPGSRAQTADTNSPTSRGGGLSPLPLPLRSSTSLGFASGSSSPFGGPARRVDAGRHDSRQDHRDHDDCDYDDAGDGQPPRVPPLLLPPPMLTQRHLARGVTFQDDALRSATGGSNSSEAAPTTRAAAEAVAAAGERGAQLEEAGGGSWRDAPLHSYHDDYAAGDGDGDHTEDDSAARNQQQQGQGQLAAAGSSPWAHMDAFVPPFSSTSVSPEPGPLLPPMPPAAGGADAADAAVALGLLKRSLPEGASTPRLTGPLLFESPLLGLDTYPQQQQRHPVAGRAGGSVEPQQRWRKSSSSGALDEWAAGIALQRSGTFGSSTSDGGAAVAPPAAGSPVPQQCEAGHEAGGAGAGGLPLGVMVLGLMAAAAPPAATAVAPGAVAVAPSALPSAIDGGDGCDQGAQAAEQWRWPGRQLPFPASLTADADAPPPLLPLAPSGSIHQQQAAQQRQQVQQQRRLPSPSWGTEPFAPRIMQQHAGGGSGGRHAACISPIRSPSPPPPKALSPVALTPPPSCLQHHHQQWAVQGEYREGAQRAQPAALAAAAAASDQMRNLSLNWLRGDRVYKGGDKEPLPAVMRQGEKPTINQMIARRAAAAMGLPPPPKAAPGPPMMLMMQMQGHRQQEGHHHHHHHQRQHPQHQDQQQQHVAGHASPHQHQHGVAAASGSSSSGQPLKPTAPLRASWPSGG